MFSDVCFYVNIHFALGVYCIQNLRQKSNWEGDGLCCKAGPQLCKVVSDQCHFFLRQLSRCHRRIAPSNSESQKPLHCPLPKKDETQVKHTHYKECLDNQSGLTHTCMMSMMTVRVLSWVGPRNFSTRFIRVMLLHSIKSSSPSGLLRTSSSFNNSATCRGFNVLLFKPHKRTELGKTATYQP